MKFLLEGKEANEYRLKFAFEPTAKQLDKLKAALSKYDLISFGPVKKTIFQTKPLDFADMDCGEIYMIDIETELPASQNIMLYDITNCMKVPESLVRVRNAHEPIQSQLDEDGDIEFDEYIPKLMDSDYKDAEPIDPTEYMGDKLSDKIIDEATKDYSEERTPYAEFMSASFNHYYPKADSDVQKDAGPTKE